MAGTAIPSDADGFGRRGAASAARGDFTAAIADFDRAHGLDPKNAGYLYQRGLAHFDDKQPLLAIADLNQALALAPDDAAARITRAELRLTLKNPAGARADLDAADKVLAKQDNLRLSLAGLYYEADAFERAIGQYDLWVASHPQDIAMASALNGRCWSRAVLGAQLDQALADCNAALKRAPREVDILDSRGLVRLRLGDLDGATRSWPNGRRKRGRSMAAGWRSGARAWRRKGRPTSPPPPRSTRRCRTGPRGWAWGPRGWLAAGPAPFFPSSRAELRRGPGTQVFFKP